jgi:hypothetical protein
MGESKRQKYIDLAKRGGGRKDFVKLSFDEGFTKKETPAPVKKGNLATKSFAKASSLDIDGEKKTEIFKNLNKLNKAGKLGSKLLPGIGTASAIFGADEVGAAERMSDELKSELNQMEEYGDSDSENSSYKKGGRVKKAKGGLIRGFPKIAKRGY